MSSFFVDKKIYKERLDICRSCISYFKPTGNCKICGCFMRVKASIRQMSCPEKKWEAVGTAGSSGVKVHKHLVKEAKEIWKDIKKLMNSYKKFLTIDKKRCRMPLLTCINNNTN